MREENQLNNICRIIDRYSLKIPLSRHLKDFFKTHPQMGSRDRRLASSFIYNYYRMGKALDDLRQAEKLAVANFLCSGEMNPLLSYCLEKFSMLKEEDIVLPVAGKIAKVKEQHASFNQSKIFPFKNLLSKNIDQEKFIESFLHQPKLWIRIRRGFENKVVEELNSKNISFDTDDNDVRSVCFSNITSLDKTDSFLNGYFEIQDWSSQQTINYINPNPSELWWDACAGSGGKSLMIADAEKSIEIFATDRRESILKNLEERFQKAGVKNFKTELVDLSTADSRRLTGDRQPDGIIADVPCSGSGTWARTPEWLTMFREDSLAQFVSLQRNITRNLSGTMKPGTPLIYLTCSVFEAENEENVEWILSNTKLSLQKSGYFEGVKKGADTMFAARFFMP